MSQDRSKPQKTVRANNVTIYKYPDGYCIVCTKPSEDVVLLIRNDGAMINTSGRPVNHNDQVIAKWYLPLVDGQHLVKKLFPSTFSPNDVR